MVAPRHDLFTRLYLGEICVLYVCVCCVVFEEIIDLLLYFTLFVVVVVSQIVSAFYFVFLPSFFFFFVLFSNTKIQTNPYNIFSSASLVGTLPSFNCSLYPRQVLEMLYS